MRRFTAAVILLFLLTPMLWMGAYILHPKAVVGIVLVDDCDESLGEIAARAFDHYGDYFDARILPERFNASYVRIKDGCWLNSDFHNQVNASRLRERWGVDIILIVTDHQIRDWDEGGLGLWGEADTETGSAVMTMAPWINGLPNSSRTIQHVALHEVFHLLGYTHNAWDTSGMMQYASNIRTLDLCPYYEVQLPARIISYKLGFGHSFGIAAMMTGMSWAFILLPAYFALELLLHKTYSSLKGSNTSSRILVPLCVMPAFVIIATLSGAFYTLLFPFAFYFFFHQLYYVYNRRQDFKKKAWSEL